jgi:hypothetical protein
MKGDNLLHQLLVRRDIVSIENGKLCLQSNSGNVVPCDWLSVKSDQLLREAVTQLGQTAFLYESYSTGNYGEHRASGLTLQFSNIASEDGSHVFFNVDLIRVRNSKKGKAGTLLPKGQFRVGKKSHFNKFWQKTGLKMPPRRSSFHDYMGKLKGLVFTGEYTKGERLNKATLQPLNIAHQQLLAAFNLSDMPYKPQTIPGQHPDNCHTTLPYKEIPESKTAQGLRPFSTTCECNYETSEQGDTGIRGKVIPIRIHKKPEDQTQEEWWVDYDSEDAN